MANARQAAIFAVEQLLPTDRVSVTIFDDRVETIVPNTAVTEKASIVARLARIEPRGTTALHAAWAEGATQVAGNRIANGLNRVLLLSDGLANVGLTDPKAIAAEVHGRHEHGVSTTTLGVGDDYNEDLMQAMALAGDGNYYFVESAVQLPDLFQTELHGLMATMGRDVRLHLEPQHDTEVADLLNDFEKLDPYQWRLPNLVAGMTIEVLVRLRVPPLAGVSEILRVRLSWDQPGQTQTDRPQVGKLLIVPAVSAAEWDRLPEDPAVRERALLLTTARVKLQAAAAMEQGDVETTASLLGASVALWQSQPVTESAGSELNDLSQLQHDLDTGAAARLVKRSKFQHYTRGRSRPPTDPGKNRGEPK